MITIEDFWRVDDQINAKWGNGAYQCIDYYGIEPIRPLEHFGYFCTPKNSLTFAATGGDGVHFGIVNGQNKRGAVGPIVMTVPMADRNNVIIAEDLEEFFSLGYYVGWFALKQIVYNLEETIRYYSKTDPEITPKEEVFLEILRKELQLRHYPLLKARLT